VVRSKRALKSKMTQKLVETASEAESIRALFAMGEAGCVLVGI